LKKPFLFNRLISNMKKTLLFLSLFLLGFTNATQAQLRTDAEMMAAAKSALSNYPKAKRLIKEKGTNLEKLMTKSQVTIIGNEERNEISYEKIYNCYKRKQELES